MRRRPAPPRRAFTFVEITIAVAIAVVCAIPIISMISSTRADSSKAINYLRGLELANEAVEWASLTPADKLDNFRSSYSDEWANQIHTVTDPRWQAVIAPTLGYCIPHTIQGQTSQTNLQEQYDKAYYRRDITMQDHSSTEGCPPTPCSGSRSP